MGTATVGGPLLRALRSSGVGSLLLAAVSLLLMVYGSLHHNPLLTRRVTYDYFVWASALLTLVAVYWELRRLRDRPLYSTALLLVLGGTFTALGRVLSLYYNRTFTVGYFGGLIGDYYTYMGYASSLLVLAGSFVVLATTALHVALRGVVVVREGPRVADAFGALLELARAAGSLLGRYPALAALAVGLLAFALRFAPELYWWPQLIGWDTPEYVAHVLDFRERFNPFASYYWMGSLRNTPPLLPMILAPLSYVVDAWYIFKVYPSVAYGALASLSALLAVELCGRRGWVGLLSGTLTAVYVLNLRISWDYHRQLLGSVVLLAAVLALERWGEPRTPRRAAAVALLLAACGLSHEVTGFAGFVLSLVLLHRGLRGGGLCASLAGAVGLAANAALEVWYWRRPYSFVAAVGVLPPGLVASHVADEVLSYLVAGYGLTLPLAIVAMTGCKARYTTAVTVALLLAGTSPLIAPYSSVAVWYRFLIGAAPLVSTLAAVGLARVARDWRAVAAYLLIASLPGLAFAYGYNWSTTYPRALREFPSRLVPSPDDPRFVKTYEFFRDNPEVLEGAVVVAEPNYGKYIHIAVRNPEPSKLIWAPSLTNETVCRAVEATGARAVIVVGALRNASVTHYSCLEELEPVSRELPWVYVGRTTKLSEEPGNPSGG